MKTKETAAREAGHFFVPETLRCFGGKFARLKGGCYEGKSRSLTLIRERRGWVPFLRQGRRDDSQIPVASGRGERSCGFVTWAPAG
jgi:hypothetical protein